MNNRRHDHDLIAILIIVIVVLKASAHALPGLRDVAATLPAHVIALMR